MNLGISIAGADELEAPPQAPRHVRRPEPRPRADVTDLARFDGNGPAARVVELGRALAWRVRERPVGTLAVAVGVGFLVGGALTFRAGRIALAVAVRRVAREVLKQVL
jgi:hypothetical protein